MAGTLATAIRTCGLTEEATAADVQCAAAGLPLDYDEPAGKQVVDGRAARAPKLKNSEPIRSAGSGAGPSSHPHLPVRAVSPL